MSSNFPLALRDKAATTQVIAMVTQLLYQSRNELAVLKSHAEELLAFLEVQISVLYRENRDWVYIGSRLGFIIGHQVLLEAAGCVSELDYMRRTMSRLGMSSDMGRKYLKAFRTYRNHEAMFIHYNYDLGFNAKALEEKKLFTKILLLDKAFDTKCNPLNPLATQDEVFRHFLNDSLRDFRFYIDPEIKENSDFRKKMREYRETIKEQFQMFEQVHLLTIPADLDIDRIKLIKLINEIR